MSEIPEGWQRHAKMYRSQLLKAHAALNTQVAVLNRILREEDGEGFYQFMMDRAADEAEPPEEGEP